MNPTPTEIAKLLVNPLVGWHDRTVYITDGMVLFAFPDREWMGERLFNEDEGAWGILDAGEWTFPSGPVSIKISPSGLADFISGEGDPIDFAAVPTQEERPEWLDTAKETIVECPECDGTGVVMCEYEHEHDCPECDGSGKAKVLAINTWRKVEDRTVSTLAGYYDCRYIWMLQKFEITQAFKCLLGEGEGKAKALLVCGDGFRAKVMCVHKF